MFTVTRPYLSAPRPRTLFSNRITCGTSEHAIPAKQSNSYFASVMFVSGGMSAFDPIADIRNSRHHARMFMIGMGLLAVVGTAAASEPPSRPVEGPQLLCFKYSTFQLAKDERVKDFSLSPEEMSLTIEGPTGVYNVAEGEIFAEPKHRGRRAAQRGQTSVYQINGKPRYAIYGLTNYSPNKDRLVIWLSGNGLSGNSKDKAIYSRFEVRDPEGAACGHVFTYSWFAE